MTLARTALAAIALSCLACGAESPDAPRGPNGIVANYEIVWQHGILVAGAEVTGPSIRLVDSNDFPVPNVPVYFHVVSGGGSLRGGTDHTDSLGLAHSGFWQLGIQAGPQNLGVEITGRGTIILGTTTVP